MRINHCFAVLVLAAAVSCGGAADPGSGTTTPTVATLASLSISPPGATITAGATLTFSASGIDQRGAAIAAPNITWSSSNAAVVSINAATGAATAISAGVATISASSGATTGTAQVTIVVPAIAVITVAGVPSTLSAGQIAQLSAVPKDASGASLTGRTVTWASSATNVAVVDNSGKVTAIGGGTTTITATSEGVNGTATIVVSGPPAVLPTIVSISPSVLVPGTVATISGANFDATPANNVITVRGSTVTALAATATQITFTVPCINSGAVDVVITSSQRKGAAFASALAAPQRSVPLGQAVVISTVACNEIPAAGGSARYLVSVFSTAPSENTLTDFEISGNTPVAGTLARVATAVVPAPTQSVTPNPNARADREHFAHLERERANYLEGKRLMSQLPRESRELSTARAAVPALGETRNFFMTYQAGCSDTTRRIGAKVIYAGSRAIIWEDSTNTLQSSADPALAGFYMRLGQIFDQDQYDVIKNNFTDPLLRDAVTDNDGHINMVFTERLNATTAAAYVTSCDQYPTTVFKGSNFGQEFYGTVPTTKGSNLNSTLYPDGWFNFMGRTVVHEVKHIASFSARFAANASTFEESWLEEGTARHAEELWVRPSIHKVAWKGNTGYGTASTNTIFCDFHPENGTCLAADPVRRPDYGMRRHFNEIKPKLQQPWNWSLFGDGSGQSGSVFYQTTWSLVRFVADRYATSEAAFFTALNKSNTSGLANLAAVSGVSADQMIGLWSLSLYADDYPGLSSPSADIQFPTWNLRSIYSGLNQDPTWASQFPTAFPVIPAALQFGSFTSQRPGLRGGANAYFEIQGTQSVPQLLDVHALGGGAASNTLRMAITRIQ